MREHHDPMCVDPSKCHCFEAPSLPGVGLSQYVPDILVISNNSKMLVTIHPDGTVTFGESYTLDKTARAFWESLGAWRSDQEKKLQKALEKLVGALDAGHGIVGALDEARILLEGK